MDKLLKTICVALVLGSQAPSIAEQLPRLSSAKSQDPPIVTLGEDIGITIMGTIIQTHNDNVALIKEKTGKVKAVKKGFVILDKFHVLGIYPKYMAVKTPEGKQFHIFQEKFLKVSDQGKVPSDAASKTATANGYYKEEGFERRQNEIQMTSQYRDHLVQRDLAKILMQATAQPHIENGKIIGFKLTQIDEGSIFEKSGVINNDVVTEISGVPLNSVADTVSLLHSLKEASQVDVRILRNGQEVNLSISVK